ncbi:S9 family peptidase [Bowmanella yangjiangensis]|uniref:S9 family peptidase n=1 Tax=Bowmanella yangjiangensis TaxID=2811230 RepID=UPI001E63C35A|nr:S9 family peptidase [Bowmanella yangjiangensis]
MKITQSLLALTLGLGSACALADDRISIDDIPTLQSVLQTSISPDGEQIAFTRSVPRELYVEENGSNYAELYLVDGKGQERAFITGKVNIGKLQWSADGKQIYFLAKMGDDKFTSLYQIPVDGGQAQRVLSLKDRNISSYKLAPNNKQIALLAKPAADKSEKELKKLGFMAEVYELGLTNQQLFVLSLDKAGDNLNPDALAIQDYVGDVNWAADSQALLVKTQPSALIDDQYMKSQWHLFDLAKQTVSLSFATEGKLGEAELSADGRYIAILGAQDKHDPATGRLYLADAKSGKVQDWLPDFKGHISDIEWSHKGQTLNFIAEVGTQNFVATIKPGSNKYKKLVKEGQFIASGLSISDSDKSIAVRANSYAHPNEVFVIRSGKAKRLSDSNPWLAEKRLAKQETIRFTAEDGVELDGVLIYPLDYQKGTRYPLIMSVHGGPESHDKDGWLTNYSRPGQMGAARGYAVFYPNYRGSTGKGVDYSKLGQNDYAGEEFNDLVRFKQHLVDMGLVDSKRVGITGGSYGGYASAWAATKLTEHFAASVMFVGVTNQLSKFGTTDISNEMFLVHARSYPWDKWQYYLERSPIYWAGQSKTPLLIMHGKDDPRVHPAQSMELYRYMKVQGKDVRLVYYPGEGHGNRKAAAQYDYSLRLMRWMDNYLIDGKTQMPDYEIDHAAKLKATKEAVNTDSSK